jgi:serine/threonine-protein kinase
MTNITAKLSTALAGRYKIESRLGEGGMATVYLAEDLKHKRKVAVKVLRPELAAVLGAERFVQEITTTANLQHPHILPLFDSGEADSFLYYVMPYIEGETLRDKIDREKQLDVDEAVRTAREVADALDYAHRQNVIHRDIKPENILLHDGRPMVADFGIALAVSAAAGGRMTETGLSLGTPHYMSPEQATAEKDISGRSDVYSLGSVLYEMLTGDPPHTGSTAQQIIMKIVTEEAQPLTELRRAVPPHVAAAVGKSLEKLPADRFATAKAFADALGNPAFTTTKQHVAGAVTGTRTARLPWAVAAAAVVVAIVAVVLPRSPDALGTASVSATLELPPEVYIDFPKLVFSPDGTRLYVTVRERGIRHLYERRLDAFEGRVLRGTQDAYMHYASPDGEWLAYRKGQSGGLYKVPADGGPPVAVDPDATWSGGDWAADGTLYYTRSYKSGIWRIGADGTGAEMLTMPDSTRGVLGHWHVRVLPGGRHLLYTAFRTPVDSARIEVLDLETGTQSLVVQGAVYGQYVPGYLLYVRNEVIFAAPFDLDRMAVVGEARPVVEGVALKPEDGIAGFAVSSTGTLAYVTAAEYDAPSELMWVDRDGMETLVVPESDRYAEPAVSPDGRRIAVSVTQSGEASDVWVLEPERGSRTRLTSGGGAEFGSVWTPDGRSVVFMSEQPIFDLYTRSWDASGPIRLFLSNTFDKFGGTFTPDGREFIFSLSAIPYQQIWRSNIDGTNPRVLLAVDAALSNVAISPTGQWLAFDSDESGRAEVYMVSYPNVTGRKIAVSSNGGSEPRWTKGGRELVWRNGAEVVAASVEPASGATGRPVVLFSGDYQYSPRATRGWDATADGERFLLVKRPTERAARRVMLVTNWVQRLGG